VVAWNLNIRLLGGEKIFIIGAPHAFEIFSLYPFRRNRGDLK
jgi:hypothetical protein